MTNDLAITKKAYLISMSNGERETVLLEKQPNREEVISQKQVVSLDGRTFNGSFIVLVKEVSLSDEGVDSAMSYAKSLKGAMKAVACERVRGYEAKNGKMPLQKLKDRIQSFMQNGKSPEREKRYKLYLTSGGDQDIC